MVRDAGGRSRVGVMTRDAWRAICGLDSDGRRCQRGYRPRVRLKDEEHHEDQGEGPRRQQSDVRGELKINAS